MPWWVSITLFPCNVIEPLFKDAHIGRPFFVFSSTLIYLCRHSGLPTGHSSRKSSKAWLVKMVRAEPISACLAFCHAFYYRTIVSGCPGREFFSGRESFCFGFGTSIRLLGPVISSSRSSWFGSRISMTSFGFSNFRP